MVPAAEEQGEEGYGSPSGENDSFVDVLGRRVVLQTWVSGVRPREAFPGHGSGGRERGSSSQGNCESEKASESGP